MALCLRTTSSAPCAVSGSKPRVTDPSSGSESVKVRRVARVVASGQINSFAMEFMVEISCLRKSATSSFLSGFGSRARCPWFRKSAGIVPAPSSTSFQKMKKSVVFLFLTALGRGWDLSFAGSFCRLLPSGSARAFCCFLNNKFQEFF